MLFNSYDFLFTFLPVTLLLYFLCNRKRLRIYILLASSYIFYSYWNYRFLPLLVFSTGLDFYIGKLLFQHKDKNKRRIFLFISLLSNLGLLAFFKYANFTIENINMISEIFGGKALGLYEIVLPVGISFYTFQSMSYTIDLYRKNSKPYNDFPLFASYVSLFPQLIAGPIIRHSDLVDQIESASSNRVSLDYLSKGLYLFILGLAKKILLADRIALAIDPVIANIKIATTLEAWACALGYTFQLYFDFSGYSDMAIGLGLLLGLKFPQNFNSPYKAYSITDFWRRWHMTLSAWLRDYLYISLGGNRKGDFRTYVNLIATMLLGGLWHGAAWTYVLWGGLHGSVLAIERRLRFDRRPSQKGIFTLRCVITFIIVVFGWVVFRSENVEMAITWFGRMFSINGGLKLVHFSARTRDRYAAALLVSIFITWFSKNNMQILSEFHAPKKKALYSAVLFFVVIMFLGADSPFLYFQF